MNKRQQRSSKRWQTQVYNVSYSLSSLRGKKSHAIKAFHQDTLKPVLNKTQNGLGHFPFINTSLSFVRYKPPSQILARDSYRGDNEEKMY